jgi:carboxyl-terminal processing protease
MLTRRLLTAASLAAVVSARAHAEPARDTTFADDFDELWQTLGERYCYFVDKSVDWLAVRRLYRPKALAAGSQDEFADIVRLVCAELYDAHTHPAEQTPGTPYWPPWDILVEPVGAGAAVVAVYAGSAAEDAGIVPGDTIVAVNGDSMAAASARYMPRCLVRADPAAARYAANVAAGGLRGQARRIVIQRNGTTRTVDLPLKHYPSLPDLEARVLPEGFGLIIIRSFAESALVAAFDTELARFAGAPGLIIDVRYNGGGDTAVARPIMGRFITQKKSYALMRRRDGQGLSAPWTEYVDPRGPFTYQKPVVVLCGHWSASMAEGFPMGMRDIGAATVVGTPMMGLGAAVYDIVLDRTGIRAQYSAEPVYDTSGVPRSAFRPDVIVPGTQDSLKVAIATLHRLCASTDGQR